MEVDVYVAPPFISLALDGGERSASRLAVLLLGTHCTGGWVGFRDCLDVMALPGIEPLLLGRPAPNLVVIPTELSVPHFKMITHQKDNEEVARVTYVCAFLTPRSAC
jgi:hypothetical protein